MLVLCLLLLITLCRMSSSFDHREVTLVRREEMDVYSLNLAERYGISPSTELPYDILDKIIKGVESNNRDNIYFYALMKLYGVSATKNVTSAAEYLKRAADLGNPDALTAYGVMLLSGNGVPQDYPQAATYFRRAIREGDSNAHWLLGKMILGTPRYSSLLNSVSIAASCAPRGQGCFRPQLC